jgi:hypothetical protein
MTRRKPRRLGGGTTQGTTGFFLIALKDWSERRDLSSGPLRMGQYPTVTLAVERGKAAVHPALLVAGIDPRTAEPKAGKKGHPVKGSGYSTRRGRRSRGGTRR